MHAPGGMKEFVEIHLLLAELISHITEEDEGQIVFKCFRIGFKQLWI
jgi:hypothetical protein